MTTTYDKSEIRKGFHPEGYKIDKSGSPMDFYTRWEISPEGPWSNPKPTCFDSMPDKGWHQGKAKLKKA